MLRRFWKWVLQYIWENHCSHSSHNLSAPLLSTIKFYVVYDEECIAQTGTTYSENESPPRIPNKTKKLSDPSFWTFSVQGSLRMCQSSHLLNKCHKILATGGTLTPWTMVAYLWTQRGRSSFLIHYTLKQSKDEDSGRLHCCTEKQGHSSRTLLNLEDEEGIFLCNIKNQNSATQCNHQENLDPQDHCYCKPQIFKVKLSQRMPWRYMGGWGLTPITLQIGIGVSHPLNLALSLHSWSFNSRERDPYGIHRIKGWVCPRCCLHALWKRKIPCSCS